MNKVDLLFIVDVTGSMGGFISQAQQKMQSMLESLTSQFGIDLLVGLSLYRDHPPQDSSFVTVVLDLMSVDKVKSQISKIGVDGGGDTPEAVIDGIIDGVNGMSWRDGSKRIAFLIGDAPAHGMVCNESCCQCGSTWGHAVTAAEDHRVSVYSILLSNDNEARDNFKLISNFTGGFLVEGKDAMDAILDTLKSEFDDINLDSKILEMLSGGKDEKAICDMLKIDREQLSESRSRIAQFAVY
jgi:hypothetical protein